MPESGATRSESRAHLALHVQHNSDIAPSAQLERQLRHLIWSGQLPAGTSLPSVRGLAADLELNPMTVSKAFAKLANQGLLEHVRGQQMRVPLNAPRLTPAQRSAEINPVLNDLVIQVRQLGLPTPAVVQRLQWLLDSPLEQITTASHDSVRSATLE